MPKTLYWIQGGSCGGDTWSLINASPRFPSIYSMPSTSRCSGTSTQRHLRSELTPLVDGYCQATRPWTFSVSRVRSSAVLTAPGASICAAGPKKNSCIPGPSGPCVLAVGTCASFGGIGADSEIKAGGLQFHKWQFGGFLGKEFKTLSGLPGDQPAGLPLPLRRSHRYAGRFWRKARQEIELTDQNTPGEWYNVMIHQGCTRNEYHQYRVEDKKFGEKGCLFFTWAATAPWPTAPATSCCGTKGPLKPAWGFPVLAARARIFRSLIRFSRLATSREFPSSYQRASAAPITWPTREWRRRRLRSA